MKLNDTIIHRPSMIKRIYGVQACMSDFTFAQLDTNIHLFGNLYIETAKKNGEPSGICHPSKTFLFLGTFSFPTWESTLLVCEFHRHDFAFEIENKVERNRTGKFGFHIKATEISRARRVLSYSLFSREVLDLKAIIMPLLME